MMNLFEDRPSFIELINKKDLVGVEIGVEGGVTSKRILAMLDVKRLYLVDPYINYGGFDGRGVLGTDKIGLGCKKAAEISLEEYSDKIVWIIDFSEFAVDKIENDLDFVYIDGNHRYEYIKKDIELYYQKVKVGGMLAGHDYKLYDTEVKEAVDEFSETIYSDVVCRNWDWFTIKE